MDIRRSFSSTSGSSRHKNRASSLLMQNGSAVLEEFLAATNGTYDVTIRMFTAKEVKKATGNFNHVINSGRISSMFLGSWNERAIVVKRFYKSGNFPSDTVYDIHYGAVKDVVTTSRMSHHNNALRILGCCLEFEHPALVYYYDETYRLLSHVLFFNEKEAQPHLPWRSRLKIASDVANVMVYLHTAFDTPIIFRILNPTNILIDQHGVAKLFDFSYSISLPPGKLHVKDDVIGVTGYIDIEYHVTGLVTQKADVYSYGVLLLVLLTGKKSTCLDEDDTPIHILHYVNNFIGRDEFRRIVDPKILQEMVSSEQEEKLQAFLHLALRCLEDKGNCRPDMIDAAKQVKRICRFFSSS